ncbi:MAG: hypothetical protein ABEI80_03195 [Haloplanus sp.]
MRRHQLVVGVVLIAVVAAGLPVTAGTTPTETGGDDSPTISVRVGNAPLTSGDTYHTRTDPWVEVSVSADTPISLVEVRVDGETRHTFEPERNTTTGSVHLDLETGRHRVSVVAKAEGVATHEATIVKDDVAPVINYSSPFPGDPLPEGPESPPSTEFTVSRANVSINSTLTDLSAIESVRITHEYQYRHPEETEATRDGRESYLHGGTSVNQSLYLVPGRNDITVRAEDAVGNVRIHEFTIIVDDGTPPSLTVTDIDWVSPTRLHVEGRVSDRIQVQSVWAEATSGADDLEANAPELHPLVFPQRTVPDRDRRTVVLDSTVYHPPETDHVVIGVNDTAGNERTRNYSLSRFLAPNVTINDRRTGYVAGSVVSVGGRITDGQVANVSVESVDPTTGRIVDIRPVELGTNGTFGTRLDGVPNRTRIRVRVRDARGEEYVTNTTVDAPAADPADPSTDAGEETDGTTGGDEGDAADGTDGGTDAGPSGIRIPIIGVVVPVPSLGIPSPLDAAITLPIPVLGPVDVPIVPVGVVALVALALVGRR